MVGYVKRLVEDRGREAQSRVDRIFQKALKFEVLKGEVVAYCYHCDEWHNQSRNKSVFCPIHGNLLSHAQYVEKTIKP